MMSHIRFNDLQDGQRIAEVAGATFNPLSDIVIARLSTDDRLMGGAVYTGYTGVGGSIQVHLAGLLPLWINQDLLWVGFDYPFNQLQIKKLFGQVPASNKHAIEVNLKFGFRPELVVKDVYPDGDMLLVSMYREHCRFLSMKPRSVRTT